MNNKLNLKHYNAGGCPYCGSDLITSGSMDPEHNYICRDFTCDTCEQSWTETYKCIEISAEATDSTPEQILIIN